MGIFDRFKKPQVSVPRVHKPKPKEEKPVAKVSQIKSEEKAKPKLDPVKKVELKKSQKIESWRILVKPLISEKATDLASRGQYVFEVSPKINKTEIAKAIIDLYNVKPRKINIINMRGKSVRHGRSVGKTKAWRKAVVMLHPQDKIEIYQGV